MTLSPQVHPTRRSEGAAEPIETRSTAAVNEVRASFFPGAFPAHSTVEVRALPREELVEMEAIACG